MKNGNPPLLEMRNITKHYPSVIANDNVSFSLNVGEIHSLLGENGAGKTTLMNVLYGMASLDSGEIFINGIPQKIHSPADAMNVGIGMVHQHFMLVERFTVVDNIVLGTKPEGFPIYNRNEAVEKVKALVDAYGFALNPVAPISQLSVGQQQRVEIIKALYRGAKILILDEPTAVLTPSEVDDFFNLLGDLRKANHGIVFISHKLNEAMEISDKITVLRQGHVVGVTKPSKTDRIELTRMMVGRNVLFDIEREPYKGKKRVYLDVKGLKVLDDRGLEAVHGVSFQVRAGEILGIAGVDGNGQKELAEALTGLRTIVDGDVRIGGNSVSNLNPMEILEIGVAHIPEDRQRRGLVMQFRVDENLILHNYYKDPFTQRGLLKLNEIYNYAKNLVMSFDIRPSQPELKAEQLSGGNQQKVVLARELSKKPRLIIAMQPTRGLDVGATEYVRKQLIQSRSNGAAILLISTELEEIFSLSDKIAVMYEGEVVGKMLREEADIEKIGLLMGGTKLDC